MVSINQEITSQSGEASKSQKGEPLRHRRKEIKSKYIVEKESAPIFADFELVENVLLCMFEQTTAPHSPLTGLERVGDENFSLGRLPPQKSRWNCRPRQSGQFNCHE